MRWFSGSTSASKRSMPCVRAAAASFSSSFVPMPQPCVLVGDRERDFGDARAGAAMRSSARRATMSLADLADHAEVAVVVDVDRRIAQRLLGGAEVEEARVEALRREPARTTRSSRSASSGRTGRMRSVRPLRRTTSDSRCAGYSMVCHSRLRPRRRRCPSPLRRTWPDLLVREVVPAAAGVVLALLDVAGERQLVDFLAGELPAVGELLELLARHAGASLSRSRRSAAQLAVAVAREALAEDPALRGELADRGLAVARAELVMQLVPQDGDRLLPLIDCGGDAPGQRLR